MDVIKLTKELIKHPSITPDDAGCQAILIDRLKRVGFVIEPMPFGKVTNFWAKRGVASPLLVFIGHTDVVPTGPVEQWTTPPFTPEERQGYLYGRGAADMKGSLAAMLIACENFIAKHPQHLGSIAWLITSDEEGASIDGTAKVVEVLKQRGEQIDYCLVGEPSSDKQLGDIIKIGRRGSLSAKLTIHGKQGHVAYPEKANNPIHSALLALAELTTIQWDEGYPQFQPTSLQISNIHSGTGAGNVIPGQLEVQFNLRYSPALTAEIIKNRVIALLQKHKLVFSLDWQHGALPFLTKRGKLIDACVEAVQTIAGLAPQLATNGGTSDGRFLAPLGCQVVELGPCNASIHQIDECVAISDLIQLTEVYYQILTKLFCE
jgi:succinyl-diaminopimelate desuccinylase